METPRFKHISAGPPEHEPARICCSRCQRPMPVGYQLDITIEGDIAWIKTALCPDCKPAPQDGPEE